MFSSSIKISPEVDSINRIKHLTKVDFPLPDKPMITNVSPLATSKETFFKATTNPKSD